MGSGNVYFAQHEGLVVLKFEGEIRYTMGASQGLVISLAEFLDKLLKRSDFDDVLLDLSETTSIDSTNLGLIASVSQFTQKNLNKKPTIIATNEEILELLESIGFAEVFNIVGDSEKPDVELSEVEEVHDKGMGLSQVLLDSHRVLMDLNEKNNETFKDLVELLQSEVDSEEQR